MKKHDKALRKVLHEKAESLSSLQTLAGLSIAVALTRNRDIADAIDQMPARGSRQRRRITEAQLELMNREEHIAKALGFAVIRSFNFCSENQKHITAALRRRLFFLPDGRIYKRKSK
jgi:hypothetical protein